jgi:hypothetical protein
MRASAWAALNVMGFLKLFTLTNIGSTLMEHKSATRYVQYFILISKQLMLKYT